MSFGSATELGRVGAGFGGVRFGFDGIVQPNIFGHLGAGYNRGAPVSQAPVSHLGGLIAMADGRSPGRARCGPLRRAQRKLPRIVTPGGQG